MEPLSKWRSANEGFIFNHSLQCSMDYVIRIKLTNKIEEILTKSAIQKKELSPITDFFYKPKDMALKQFNPNQVIVRLRKFSDRETITKIKIIKAEIGYTDKKEQLNDLENYEQWGQFTASSIRYQIKLNEQTINVLKENFPFGKFIKIEAPSEQLLRNAIDFFEVEPKDIIQKNSTALFAESMRLI